MKRCSKCRRSLARSAFYRDASRKDGLEPRCKRCGKIKKLVKKYSVTEAEWLSMYTANFGLCHSCDRPFVPEKTPHVDHDHKTDEVRGLLCNDCNRTVGNHSVEYLVACAAYVARSKVGEKPLGLEFSEENCKSRDGMNK